MNDTADDRPVSPDRERDIEIRTLTHEIIRTHAESDNQIPWKALCPLLTSAELLAKSDEPGKADRALARLREAAEACK